MNLISFVPIMMNKFSVFSSESMIKYFIIQSMGSGILFISIMLMLFIDMYYLTLVGLMIKIGCPPFHLWFPSVMEGLTWFSCFVLSTIQQFIPMVMLTYLSMNMIIFITMLYTNLKIGFPFFTIVKSPFRNFLIPSSVTLYL